jgi:RNA polymerase sigma factor (sigma-70 family)
VYAEGSGAKGFRVTWGLAWCKLGDSGTLALAGGKGRGDSMTNSDADHFEALSTDPGSALVLLRDLEWVQRLAFRMCSDWALAEDLRQEAALALIGQRGVGETGRRQWLAGVVRNKLRMQRRSDGRRRDREADAARAEVVSLDVDVVERAESQREVADAVLRLREPYRTTVLHRFFDQWTPTEIAERTGTSVDTVKSRLKRGLQALEDDLSRTFRDADDRSEGAFGAGWFSALLPLAVMESNRRALAASASGAQGLASVSITTVGLLPMISKALFLPLSLLVLYGVFLLSRPSVDEGAPTTAAAPEVAEALSVESSDQAERAEDVLRRPSTPEVASPSDAAEGALPPGYDLSGQVMDDRGGSLTGVRVSLHEGGGELLGEAKTGPDGRFALSVPQQDESQLELRFEGEWFHSSEWLEFGGRGYRGRLPLTAGARDLGGIVLEAAGAVSGTVVDADGAPVAGATLTTWGGATTTSAEDGSFRLDRLSPGADGLEVRADGAPIAEVEFTVRASEIVDGVDVRLRPSRSIVGRVVDRRGQPVPDALVELDPVDQGDVSRTRSGPDGRFEVPFLWLEPAYLRVDAEGYDLWDSEEWDQEVSPESDAMRVELIEAAIVEFLVVDATTGLPVELYGLEIHKGAGSEGMQVAGDAAPDVEDHPEGRVTAKARDEFDRVVVVADGYERFSGDVEPTSTTSDGSRLQTIQLERTEVRLAGSIQGRVLREGAPLANAFVEAVGGKPMGNRMKQLTGETGEGFLEIRSGLPLVRTAKDGTFRINGLDTPLVRVRIYAPGSSSMELPIVKLGKGATEDLGDIECVTGATVRGQVVMPPGVSPMGLVASIGTGLGYVRAPLDGAGNFELLHVPAGMQTVDISVRDGDFEYGAEADVLIREGENHYVQIDASGMGIARVRLRVELDGAPADSCKVLFMDAQGGDSVVAMAHSNESGDVDVRLPAVGDVSVCVLSELDALLRHPSARLRLESGVDIEQVLSFQLGTAEVAIDPGRTLPSQGFLFVELLDPAGVAHQRVSLEVEGGQVQDSPDASLSVARESERGFVLELHRVLVGDWAVNVSVLDLELVDGENPKERVPETWLEGRAVTVR